MFLELCQLLLELVTPLFLLQLMICQLCCQRSHLLGHRFLLLPEMLPYGLHLLLVSFSLLLQCLLQRLQATC